MDKKTIFRDLKATSTECIQMKNRFFEFFSDYEEFLKELTLNSNKTKDGTSGTANSYKNYLIKLFVFFEEFSNIKISNPYSLGTYNLVATIKNFDEYIKYNKKKDYYLSSALNRYLSFLVENGLSDEEDVDYIMNTFPKNDNINVLITSIFYEKNVPVDKPVEKAEKILYRKSYIYPRNISEVRKAKRKANWKCEINSSHNTFIKEDESTYIEAHHLIPMATQDLYRYSIDLSDNITCLCPNCHRKIHLAKRNEKIEMIEYLYENRREKLASRGIEIKKNDLLAYYRIID